MKDYLNNTERLNIVAIYQMLETEKQMLETNLLLKEEKTNFKKSITFMQNALNSLLPRLNPTAKKMLGKALRNVKVYVSSNSDIEIYAKRKSNDIEAAYEENREYFRLVELIMFHNCQNCNKCNNDCEFYKEFEENCIPEFDGAERLGNCKYAYTLKKKE